MNFRSDNEAGAHPLITPRWTAPSPRAAPLPLAKTSGHDGSSGAFGRSSISLTFWPFPS
jgi:hypothetical protein